MWSTCSIGLNGRSPGTIIPPSPSPPASLRDACCALHRLPADERLVGHNHDESSLSSHHRPPDCWKADDTLKERSPTQGVTSSADSSGRKIPAAYLLLVVVVPDVTCLYARSDESLMRTSRRDRPGTKNRSFEYYHSTKLISLLRSSRLVGASSADGD